MCLKNSLSHIHICRHVERQTEMCIYYFLMCIKNGKNYLINKSWLVSESLVIFFYIIHKVFVEVFFYCPGCKSRSSSFFRFIIF